MFTVDASYSEPALRVGCFPGGVIQAFMSEQSETGYLDPVVATMCCSQFPLDRKGSSPVPHHHHHHYEFPHCDTLSCLHCAETTLVHWWVPSNSKVTPFWPGSYSHQDHNITKWQLAEWDSYCISWKHPLPFGYHDPAENKITNMETQIPKAGDWYS